MSLIEGVGDEVTVGCGILLLLCLVLLAWFSTHTREIPFVSIIVVELSQRRRLSNRNRTETSQERSTSGEAALSESSAAGSQSAQDAPASEGESERTDTDVSSEEVSEHSPSRKNNEINTTSRLPSDSDDGAAENNDSAIGKTDDVPVQNVIKEKSRTGETAAAEAAASVSDTTHSPDSVDNVAATTASTRVSNSDRPPSVNCQSSRPDSDSPDEVRKRRVAYFEASRKKEYTESNDDSRTDSTDKHVPAATAETVGSLCETDESIPTAETIQSQSQKSNADDETDSSSVAANVQDPETVSGSEAAGSVQSGESDTSSATASQQIRVRLKYLNDTQRLVYTSPQETIGNFRRTHFSTELEENKIVRFIFNGQDLRNDLRTLSAYNIADNSVIHCLITQSRQEQESSNAAHALGDDDLELGVFIYPIFGLILGVLWYFRFSYKQYFNAVSTVSLAGVSFIYCLALVSSLRGRQQPHQHLD